MDPDYISDFFTVDPSNERRLQTESPERSSQEHSPDSLENADQQTRFEEIEPLVVPRFFNLTSRSMPLSPHYVFEEEFSNNPWILLVTTIFLTKTSGKSARPFMRKFFEEYPTPYHVLDVNPAELETFFDSLGLKKRAQIIWKMTYQFVSAKWRRASDLFGVGKYGEDAYRIFILGHTDVDPSDRYVRLYLDWLRRHTRFLEDKGIEDCELFIDDPVLKYYSVTLRDL